MKKRVLMVATVPSMIGQFNMNNIHILQGMGYTVDVAADFSDTSVWPIERVNHFKDELKDIGVKTYHLNFSRSPLKIFRHIDSYNEIVKLINKRHYSFIHTHTPIASAIVRLASMKTKTRVIYTAHGFHFYKGAPLKNWLIYYPIEMFLSWFTDVLITINKEDYRFSKRHMHAKKVVYVPGVGVDIDRFNDSVVDANAVRQTLGLKKDDFMLLSVGELSKRKNHEIVLQALNKIKKEDISIDSIHYFICGKGILEDYLYEKSGEYGINLHLLGFRNDIADLCKSTDLFIFPSFQEGLPVALMEAIACKAPILCSNIRGNVDLISKENQLFDPDDSDSVKMTLKMFLDSCKSKKGKESIKCAVEENFDNLRAFGIDTITKKMERIYSKVN